MGLEFEITVGLTRTRCLMGSAVYSLFRVVNVNVRCLGVASISEQRKVVCFLHACPFNAEGSYLATCGDAAPGTCFGVARAWIPNILV